ncbi:MAG: hypothetical protein WBM13_13455, partial [Bacteroidia bacterium]
MRYLIDIIIVLLLLLIVWQDFRYRLISWPLIPLIFISFSAKGFFLKPFIELTNYTIVNICFISLQLAILTLYVSIKNKKITNIINSQLGLGDILFFISITIAFSPFNFILFYISGLIFSLACYQLFLKIKTSATKEIPLAGLLSIVLI